MLLRQLQVCRWHILKYSTDEQARLLYQYRLELDRQGHVGRGRHSSPCLDLEDLELRALTLPMAKSRGGRAPGFNSLMKKKWFKQSRLAAQRQVIVDMIKQEAKDARLAPLHDYEMQNDWMRWGWDWLMHKDLTWQKVLYQYSDKLLKWVLNAQLNTLPTPSNMRRWRIHGDFRCGLCKKANVGLTHILAGCPYVHGTEHKNPLLPEDRYTWRHNCVLLVLCRAIQAKLKEVNSLPLDKNSSASSSQPFVSAGSVHNLRKAKRDLGLLANARDWECDFDLPELREADSKYVFPHDVCETTYRVDGYVVSRSTRFCIVGPDLACPSEEKMDTVSMKSSHDAKDTSPRRSSWCH